MTKRRSPLLPTLLGLFLVLFALNVPTLAQSASQDPKDDVKNPLRYIPNNALTGISTVLVFVVAVAQTILIFRRGAKWMMAMTIAAYFFGIGLAFRFGLHSDPHSRIAYIGMYTLVTLSPCGFIAADYVLLGRLAVYLGADKYLLVSSRRLTLVFVLSDVFTFLVQAAGGGLTSAGINNPQNLELGPKIFFGGLVAQLISFAFFTILYIVFLYRVYKNEEAIWGMDTSKPWYSRWTTLGVALLISCVGILIRSFYRSIELSEGFGGPLSRSEGLFYGLDTLPLLIAISVYVPFWPGRFIQATPIGVHVSGEAAYARVDRNAVRGRMRSHTNRVRSPDGSERTVLQLVERK